MNPSPRIAGFVLLAVAISCYLPALGGGFIIDDALLLTDNLLIRTNTGLLQIWASRRAADYFPLTLTSFWIEWRLWETNPLGYHAVNIALHAVSACLIYRLLVRLEIPGAFLAALLFAVHPINVPSVAWIAERKNTLSLPLYLASALLFVRAEQTANRRSQLAAVGTFVLALLAKTIGVAVPFLYLGWLWLRRRSGRGLQPRDWLRISPYFLASLVSGLLTIWFQLFPPGENGWAAPAAPAPLHRLALASRAIWFYAGKLAVPVDLRSFYPAWNVSFRGLVAFVPIAALAALWVVLWRGRDRAAPVRWALAAMVVLLLPVLGIANMSYHRFSWVADHWAYLPMIPVMALLGFAASKALGWLRGTARQIAIAVTCGLLILLATQTASRAHTYAGEERLWRHLLARDPASWIGHSQLSAVLAEAGQESEAEKYAREALRLSPQHAALHVGLGLILAHQARNNEALVLFERALALAPRYGKALQYVVQMLVVQGRLGEAEAACRRGLALDSQNEYAHAFLARLLQKRGALDEAMEHARAALTLDPASFSWNRLVGSVLVSQGHTGEAVVYFRRVLDVAPDDRETQREMAELEKRRR